MKKKILKYGVSVLFIVVILYLTFRLLFAGQELPEIIAGLKQADLRWILPGALTALCYPACEGLIIHYMLRAFGRKANLPRCIQYSFIGFFYCYITPSSSGGQPMQMYFMRKDGCPLGESTIIMLIIAAAYKAVLVIMSSLLLLFNSDTAGLCDDRMVWLVLLGFLANILFVAFLIVLLMRPKLARKTGLGLVNFLGRRRLIGEKRRNSLNVRINRVCDNYTQGAAYIRTHPRAIVSIVLLTAAERICLLSVPWFVCRSCGLSEFSLIDILTLQCLIAVAVELLPLPGAAGITEGCFLLAFTPVFGAALVKPGLLISRGLSFYLILIVGGLAAFSAHFLQQKRSGKNKPEKQSESKQKGNVES